MHILTNKLWQILLSPFSIVYGLAITLRNLLYDYRILTVHRIQGCPVICVGNITVGGTGKTPAVEYLADYLLSNNKKVAILSRGYGRESTGTVLVSDGKRICTTPRNSGDEPYLLATNLKGVVVVVENDRVAGAAFIKNKFHPDVIILDDGFQHRRLHRDADIVLYDCSTPLGLPFTLPGGKLREPLWNLKRADMIWLSRTDQSIASSGCEKLKSRFRDIPFIQTRHAPSYLVSLPSFEKQSLKWLTDKRVCIFSGIGNPAAFRRTVEDQKAQISGEIRFSDHHSYSKTDLIRLEQERHNSDADILLTTEKDAMRLRQLPIAHLPLYYLRIKLDLMNGTPSIQKLLKV